MEDPYTLADLLLLYFRSLPETIFTTDRSFEFEKAVEETNDNSKILKITKLIFSLPLVNKYLLKILIEHLTKVIAHEKENKMSVNNIAIVFVPSMNCNAKLFAFLIIKYQMIFAPKCSSCSQLIRIEEDLFELNENEDDQKNTKKEKKFICMKCNFKDEVVNKGLENKSYGYVEATPNDPKKKSLIRSLSQKWKERKKEVKKGNASDVEGISEDENSKKFEGTRMRSPKKFGNSNSLVITKRPNDFSEPHLNGERVSGPVDRFSEKNNRNHPRKNHSSDSYPLERQSEGNQLMKSLNLQVESTDTSIDSPISLSVESNLNSKDIQKENQKEDNHKNDHIDTNGVETVEEKTGKLKLFGSPLARVCKKTNGSVLLPSIVRKCIDYIEKKGLEIEEIYRIPGDVELVKNLRKTLDEESTIDFDKILVDLPPPSKCHTVTMLFKLYLRQLPSNLFTEDHILNLEDVIRNEKEREKKITSLAFTLSLLPAENRTLILHMISHFRSVTKKIGKNKMSIQRLSIIFKEVLFCSQELITTIYEYRRAILQPSCFFCKKMIPMTSRLFVVENSKIHCGVCDKDQKILIN